MVEIASLQSSFSRSIASGVFAKGVGLVNQIFAIPLIALAAGTDGLSRVLLAISIASWFNVLPLGSQIALPVSLIGAGQDIPLRRRILAAATTVYAVSALVCLTVGLLLAFPFRTVFTLGLPPAGAMSTAVIMNAMYLFTWMSEQTLAADRRTYIFNVASAIGSILSLVGTYCSYALQLPTEAFIVAYYLSLLVPTVGMYGIVASRAGLRRTDYKKIDLEIRRLARVGERSLSFQFSSMFKLQATLLVVAVATTTSDAAVYGSGIRFCTLFVSAISILFNPLLAESGHLVAAEKHVEYRKLCMRVVTRGCLLAVVTIVAVSVLGPTAFAVWLGHVASIDHLIAFWLGALASSLALQFTVFYLFAPVILGPMTRLVLWIEGPTALLLGYALVPDHGVSGMLCAVTTTSIVASAAMIREVFLHHPRFVAAPGASISGTQFDEYFISSKREV